MHRHIGAVILSRVSNATILYATIACLCLLLSSCFHSKNYPPTANASIDNLTPSLGDIVTLDGSLSSDVDGDSLRFKWEIMSRPLDSQATLSDPSIVNPTMQIDKDGAYQVKLVVSDGDKSSKADFVNFSTINLKPKGVVKSSDATQGDSYIAGEKIELDASESFDPEQQDLFYNWNLTAKPEGSQAFLDNDKAVAPTFVPDLGGQYIVLLVVDDGEQVSVTVSIQFSVISANDPPVAIVKDVTLRDGKIYVVGDTILLDGSDSYDPEEQPLIYRWEILEKPDDSLAELSATNALTTSFRADATGHYIIHLYVDDSVLQSKPTPIIFDIEKPIRLTDTRPFAEAGPDQPLYSANTLIQLDGTFSYDVENDDLLYQWDMLAKPEGSFAVLSNVNAAKPEFNADILGSYVAQLIVSDINGESHFDVVVVTPHEDPKLACSDCHNNEIARGKAANHLLNYDDCGSCHSTDKFLPTTGEFHAHGHKAKPSICVVCHDGIFAKTKPFDHIETDKDCNACHLISNGTWVPALRVPGNPGFGHTGISSGCVACHDDIIQKGKPEGHVPSSSRCGACHAINAWAPGRHLEHTRALGACKNCHDPGQEDRVQPKNHLKTKNKCLACHTEENWLPVLRVDHTQVIGSCSSCHDGIKALGKPDGHIVSSTFCDKCHNTNSWLELSITHDFFTGECVSCHNGIVSTGAPESHALSFSLTCQSCHNEINWTPDRVDHGQVLGDCRGCHDQKGNRYAGNNNHLDTTDTCDSCHTTKAWNVVIVVDHTQVIGKCVDCHDNVTARWKISAHINSVNECDACHSTQQFLPAITVDHNMVVGACVSCHDGSIRVGKRVGHIQSSVKCEACHSATTFIPAVGVDHREVLGSCDSCHNNVLATGMPDFHIKTTTQCGMCHTINSWLNVSFVSHGQIGGVCSDCHLFGDSPVIPDSHSEPVIFPDLKDCGKCHSTLRWSLTFPADHEIVTTGCAQSGCHDGVSAISQPFSHTNTTDVCEFCHSSRKFSPVVSVPHSEILEGSCFDCHNGAIASGKSTAHVSSSDTCDTCHAIDIWVPVNFQHEISMGFCFGCHNGAIATGKSASHTPSDNQCENCHSQSDWSIIILSVQAHIQLSPKTCVSSHCHFSGISHPPSVVEDCGSCHIFADWLNWARPTTQRAQLPVIPIPVLPAP